MSNAALAVKPAVHALDIHPVAGRIGAEIRGVDLGHLDDATFAKIHEAWLDHLLLVFRAQSIEERGRPSVSRDIRRHEPNIIDRQPPVTDRRLARRRIIFEDESPVRKGPGICTPAALTFG